MRGDLTDTGLEAIFGELSEAEATGALHLEGHAGAAKVFLRDGDVYYASSPAPRAQLGARLVGAGFIDDDELDRALAAQESGPSRTKLGVILVDQGMVRRDVIRVFVQEQILDAVFDLARWDEGAFEFFKGDAVAEDLPVQIPIRPLLMEVRRRLSEWADIAAVIPSLDAVPDFVPSGSTTQAALEPDEFTLLTSVDGRRSIRELAHDLGYSQFDAARLIYGLSLLGVIGVPNGQRAADADLGPEPEVSDGGARAPEGEPTDTAAGTVAEQGTDEDDVDVGRALDEALFGTPYDEEDGAQDAGTDIDADTGADTEQPAEPPAEPPTEPPGEQPAEQPVGSDDLEPEVWSASIDTDGTAATPEPPPRPEPAPEPAPEPTPEPTTEPATEPISETPAEPEAGPDAHDELIALVGELQSEPDEAEEPEAREPDPPASAPPDRTERGDVSELLRELSRLAGGGPEPVAPSPHEPEDAGQEDRTDGPSGPRRDEPPAPRGRPDDTGDGDDATDEGDDKGDDKRSTFRRLFGSR